MNREDFLKNEIKKQKCNIKDFAARINMPYSTLLSILNKSVGGASLDNIIKICNGLNISIETLNPDSREEKDPSINTDYKLLNQVGIQRINEYIGLLSNNKQYTYPQNKKKLNDLKIQPVDKNRK